MVSAWYTQSLHQKANLRKMIESWFSVAFDDDKLKADGGIDLDKLIGRTCALTVSHVENKEGKTRAIIAAVSPLADGMTELGVDDSYKRQEDRDGWQPPEPSAFESICATPGNAGGSEADSPPPSDTRDFAEKDPDDDIPF